MAHLKIVSGGQTGVDRAALDAALGVGLETGGWCPAGRRAEDGRIPPRYPLDETPGREYAQRTEWNVRDSDATLILARGGLSGGTRLTAELAVQYGRPLLVVDLQSPPERDLVLDWLIKNTVRILNLAGPRESGAAGIQAQAGSWLEALFSRPGE